MEGLTAAAGVIAVIQITGTAISLCYDLRGATAAPKEVIQITTSLIELSIVLEKLLRLAERHDPRLSSLDLLNGDNGALNRCQTEVLSLLNELQTARGKCKIVQDKLFWQLKEPEISKRLDEIGRIRSILALALKADEANIHLHMDDTLTYIAKEISATRNREADLELQKILHWLCTTNYGEQQRDFVSKRQQGLGSWFLQSSKFNDWLYGPEQTLYCPGDPGTGKTMMVAAIIEHLLKTMQTDTVRVAYLYCNYKTQDVQSVSHYLGALLRQLIHDIEPTPKPVQELYDRRGRGNTNPTLEDLEKALQSVCKEFSRVYIVIDALDECDDMNGSHPPRMTLLSTVRKLQTGGPTKLLCTSRPLSKIGNFFKQDLTSEISSPDSDIRLYVAYRLRELTGHVQQRRGVKAEIVRSIVNAAGGIFLLAKLSVDSLKDKMTVDEIRETLRRLSSGTDAYAEAYKEVMERIRRQPKGHRNMALKALAWITCARRNLSPVELQHALAVKPGDTRLNADNFADIDDVLSVCVGLVTKDVQNNIVRLAHYTTQNYLDKNKDVWFPDAEPMLALTCITYLSFENLGSRPFTKNPLLQYSARHWGDHYRESDVADMSKCNEQMRRLALEFAQNPTFVSGASGVLSNLVEGFPCQGRKLHAPHLAAHFGATSLLSVLLERHQAHKLVDEYGRQPLWYACCNGHERAVHMLLNNGADVNYALNNESYHGGSRSLPCMTDITMIRLDFEKSDSFCETPLHVACWKGHEKTVRMLLDHGADLKAPDGCVGFPLYAAARNGHEKIVKILLDVGTDVNMNYRSFGTSLSVASAGGYENIVQMLLDHGALTFVPEDHYNSSGYARVGDDHEEIGTTLRKWHTC